MVPRDGWRGSAPAGIRDMSATSRPARVAGLEADEAIAAAMPDPRLVRIGDAGHNCFLKDPAGFNRILEQFLTRVASTTS